MKITLLAIGKTDDERIRTLVEEYVRRLKRYVPFELKIVPDLKKSRNLNESAHKLAEGKELLKQLNPSDHVILLDENGTEYSSVQFSGFLQKKMNSGLKNLVFVIGGPYGFSEEMYQRGEGKLSLSSMTFSHQMVRLFFVEQLYRAFTILRNEPYHHQ